MNLEALFERHPQWQALSELCAARVYRHGNSAMWEAALAALPGIRGERLELADRVRIAGPIDPPAHTRLVQALERLRPWRKGPFELFDVTIDAEWRSDWKWQRLVPHLADLAGETVLDVGCGNGYFGWRLLGAGAARVVGIDPTILYFMQHRAIVRYAQDRAPALENWLLPLAFEDLSPILFDTVLSMGVVYHRSEPAAHVRRLLEFTRPGGRVVLESLVVDAQEGLRPAGRYARMRNVPLVPSTTLLTRWLREAGCSEVAVVDVTATTTGEQRRTPWMTFDSLAEALNPSDPRRTVEGHPAPVRATLIGRRPP